MRQDGLTVVITEGGGRGSALAWKMLKSPRVKKLYFAPGNGGFDPKMRRPVREFDLEDAVRLAKEVDADLVVPSTESWLVPGLMDLLTFVNGTPCFGPSKGAARLEGSKSYTKDLCTTLGMPTAYYKWTENYDRAVEIINTWNDDVPPVIKADGPAAGKGVIVARTIQEALDAAKEMLVHKVRFGLAGSRIVIEKFLKGLEMTFMALCDGEDAVMLPESRDSKRLSEGDLGPNTGGMRAFSPVPGVDAGIHEYVRTRFILPTLKEMARRGAPFRGVLYAGMMMTESGLYLVEYNVRPGDPETQAVLPRVESDLVEYMLACLKPGGLSELPPLVISPRASVCTVLVSKGYPDAYVKGFPITGLDKANGQAHVFHAGTEMRDSVLVTNGGRVVGVVGLGDSLKEAHDNSIRGSEAIEFEGKSFRRDKLLSVTY